MLAVVGGFTFIVSLFVTSMNSFKCSHVGMDILRCVDIEMLVQ